MQIKIKPREIKTLFLDIGGVLLTDGWGHESRNLAVEKFGLDKEEMEQRHRLVFSAFEMSKITLDEYLDLVVFYEKRAFSREEFKTFIFAQSQELDGHIEYFKELKHRYKLKVFALSNEGREINEHRIKTFRLDELYDGYISSCYVHLHKPDKDMILMAFDISHTLPENVLYIDDRSIYVDIVGSFGLQTLHFKGLDTVKEFIKTCTFHKHTS